MEIWGDTRRFREIRREVYGEIGTPRRTAAPPGEIWGDMGIYGQPRHLHVGDAVGGHVTLRQVHLVGVRVRVRVRVRVTDDLLSSVATTRRKF